MWVMWSRQAAQSSRWTHSKEWFQWNPFTPYPLSLPSNPLPLSLLDAASLPFFRCSADVELVAGKTYSKRLCGLRSLSVAIRAALDWTADTKWAAASALNCENKYWKGLRCASQALSPIVICLGVHTGGSVCLGLKPPHVVAAAFFSRWITLLEGAFFNNARCRARRARALSFCRSDNFSSSLLSGCVFRASICERLVKTFKREITGVRGCGPLRGRRQTKHLGQVDLDVLTL